MATLNLWRAWSLGLVTGLAAVAVLALGGCASRGPVTVERMADSHDTKYRVNGREVDAVQQFYWTARPDAHGSVEYVIDVHGVCLPPGSRVAVVDRR